MPSLKISVMGDSISTYEGFIPPGYAVYYAGETTYENGLKSVNDTWWKQVIDALGGELCVNNSYSGSLVSGQLNASACSELRCSALHAQTAPDLVLIYMGTNDMGWRVEPGSDDKDDVLQFYGAYRTMLRHIRTNYPAAKIVCATLLNAYFRGREELPLAGEDADRARRYNDVIRKAVRDENCLLADIALAGERYESLDGLHPTRAGHAAMAKLFLDKLAELL